MTTEEVARLQNLSRNVSIGLCSLAECSNATWHFPEDRERHRARQCINTNSIDYSFIDNKGRTKLKQRSAFDETETEHQGQWVKQWKNNYHLKSENGVLSRRLI